ncbi:hypothetical protein M407DRAFT_221628 [Tulasnella calospora MUT 4182]|uniref:RING-type domain-containing protein n=1 Tax=Tulasnella calospora MUT 4182 TaxID=1051891 RepID=A0A0C3MBH1_9AGAM|nr:hypothetical protein M407DRAFT_221628 [Tulasnella calospora MUT 4182]
MECIQCPSCRQTFNSSTAQAHCFPCGYLLCLACIRSLKTVGCPIKCSLPLHYELPRDYSPPEIPQLNVGLTRKVFVDFTPIVNLRQNELIEQKRIFDELYEAYERLLDNERARRDGETQALVNVVIAKLDELPSKIKPHLTPAEHVDAATSTDEASNTSHSTTWNSRGVRVNPSLPAASIPSQTPFQIQASTVPPQQLTSTNVPVSNASSSDQTDGSQQTQATAQGHGFGISSAQPGVAAEAEPPEDTASQPQSSTSSDMPPSPPSPVRLRPMTNAERNVPHPGAGTPSIGLQVPQSPISIQFLSGPAASTSPSAFVFRGSSAQGITAQNENGAGGIYDEEE